MSFSEEEKRERRNAAQRKYYAANKEKLTEKTRKYRAENPEKTRQYGRDNYALNKEKLRIQSNAYTKTLKGRYSTYRRGATKRGLDFGLSLDEFSAYWGKPCNYCGVSMEERVGIDRVDNTKGYIVSNCVSCCRTCNVMKQTLGVNEFIAHCQRIVDHAASVLDTDIDEWYESVWEHGTPVPPVNFDLASYTHLASVRIIADGDGDGEWIRLQEYNSWGSIYYAPMGTGLDNSGICDRTHAVDLKPGQVINVRFPDGKTGSYALKATQSMFGVSDHGNSYSVEQERFSIIVDVNGVDTYVSITNVEVSI